MIRDNLWICPIKPRHQDEAYYSITRNEIIVPEKEQFQSGEAFYGTLFHEMVPSTGAEGVLDRLQPTSFGSKEYAREELVAELGSALIAQRYGMTKHIKEDSCAYLKGWLDELKESPQFIKTTLLDVKRASSIVTQKVDKIAQELEQNVTEEQDKTCGPRIIPVNSIPIIRGSRSLPQIAAAESPTKKINASEVNIVTESPRIFPGSSSFSHCQRRIPSPAFLLPRSLRLP